MSDPNFDDVVLLLHCDGTDGATSFPDNSNSNHTVTANGDVEVDTAQSKFGGASARLPGSDDFLSVPDSDDWHFGSGEFTIEFWVRFSFFAPFHVLMQQYGSGQVNFRLYVTSSTNLRFRYSEDGSTLVDVDGTFAAEFAEDTWYHIAVDRVGDTLRLYVDGAVLTSADLTGVSLHNSTEALNIGAAGASFETTGWMDDIRITKGTGRYGGSFTPPSEAFPDSGATPGVGAGVQAFRTMVAM